MPKDVTIAIARGCPLATQPTISLENIPQGGFSQLTNWRRQADQLLRREGWHKFAPIDGVAAATQYEYDAVEDVQQIAQVVRPNGERVIVGASQTQLKRFNASNGTWEIIGTGFSASGKRWQVIPSMNGFMVLNNTVDLPVVFRAEWRTVIPIYEMREVGIAAVGRITEYNGFLFARDITYIRDDQLDLWMNGSDPYGIPSEDITERHPQDVTWSEHAEPRRWAPQFDLSQPAASTTVTLPFPSSVFKPVVSNQATLANPHGGVAFDGTYIWMMESYIDADNRLVRIDPVTGATSYFSNTYGSASAVPYAGLIYDEGSHTLWAIPHNSPVIVKFDIATSVFTSIAHGQTEPAYAGGFTDGANIWLAPFDSSNITKVQISDNGLTHYAHGQGAQAFHGATTDGTYGWFAPYDSNNFLKVLLSDGSITTIANSYGNAAFTDAKFDGSAVWFAPYDAADVVKIVVATSALTGYTHALGTNATRGIVFDERNMWLVPWDADVFTRVNIADGALTKVSQAYGDDGFYFGVWDGQSVWLAPYDAGSAVRLIPPMVDPDTETRVGVINAGADGGILGGQTNYENGIRVTAVNGAALTLELTTDAALTYPRNIGVTRWTDINTLVGVATLEGEPGDRDAMLALGLYLVVYFNDRIYVGRFTGIAAEPFQFRPRYVGQAVPMFGDCVLNVEGKYHLYPALNGKIMTFDGLTEPREELVCTHARDLFFAGLTADDVCFAADLPFTDEALFMRPDTTFAYGSARDNQGVSEIDVEIGAAAFVQKPGDTTDWFILAIGRFVYQYGFENNAGTTWLRDGAAAIPVWKSGLLSFNDQHNEKTLLAWTPLYSSPSPDLEMTVTLRSTYNPSAALTVVLNGEVLPSPEGENFIPCMYQAIFLQDEVRITDARDLDVRMSGRLFTVERVRALGVTRMDQ